MMAGAGLVFGTMTRTQDPRWTGWGSPGVGGRPALPGTSLSGETLDFPLVFIFNF